MDRPLGLSENNPNKMVNEEKIIYENFLTAKKNILAEIKKVIIGQEETLQEILIAIICSGHCLLVGVPGLAKTLIVKVLAKVFNLQFSRIQFTPDLMPADVTGYEILQQESSGERTLKFLPGPIFGNLILADEINRTPPKTQSALLQAMQEHCVTVGGQTYKLPNPFLVLATQNPIEQEGTYPLPEAQLDRFMLNVIIDYPRFNEEVEIIQKNILLSEENIKGIFAAKDLIEVQKLIPYIPAAPYVINYVANLIRATRPYENKSAAAAISKKYIQWGAGPRAAQHLIIAAKGLALLQEKSFVNIEDVKKIALPVLRHRLILNFEAEAENKNKDEIIQEIISNIPVDK